MLYSVPFSEKAKAVQYLIDHIPDETMKGVANLIRENGKDWWIGHHHGFGMGVRNLLREGGFDWGPVDMDNLWVGLVERAVRKKFRTKSSAPTKQTCGSLDPPCVIPFSHDNGP
jgi:hypothetical protein